MPMTITIPRSFGGTLILGSSPATTPAATTSVTAIGRDGKASGLGRDGKVAAAGRDGQVTGKGR